MERCWTAVRCLFFLTEKSRWLIKPKPPYDQSFGSFWVDFPSCQAYVGWAPCHFWIGRGFLGGSFVSWTVTETRTVQREEGPTACSAYSACVEEGHTEGWIRWFSFSFGDVKPIWCSLTLLVLLFKVCWPAKLPWQICHKNKKGSKYFKIIQSLSSFQSRSFRWARHLLCWRLQAWLLPGLLGEVTFWGIREQRWAAEPQLPKPLSGGAPHQLLGLLQVCGCWADRWCLLSVQGGAVEPLGLQEHQGRLISVNTSFIVI